jgi:ribonuclease HII
VTPPTAPYRYEGQAWRTGVARIAGLDEAGRGPLAGPVVAAAVVIDPDRRIKRLADSKLLTPERRAELFDVIMARAVTVGVGIIDHLTIDRINILQATKLAMAEALRQLTVAPDLVITDFVALANLPCPQKNHRGQGHARSHHGGDRQAVPRLWLRPSQGLRHRRSPRRPRPSRAMPVAP